MPFFQHDCNDCIYLGSMNLYGEMRDFYFCPAGSTVIARHGEGPDYSSNSLKDYISTRKDLLIATVLAVKRGLFQPEKLARFYDVSY